MKYISKGDGKYEVEKLKKGGRKATRKENVKKKINDEKSRKGEREEEREKSSLIPPPFLSPQMTQQSG